jgi:predicted DNA binding CopG/RHH family protein
MTKKRVRSQSDEQLEEIARQAEQGQDVSEHFSGHFTVKQRINVDFPLELLNQIDSECRRLGISRQAWIKVVCDEKLQQVAASLQLRKAS